MATFVPLAPSSTRPAPATSSLFTLPSLPPIGAIGSAQPTQGFAPVQGFTPVQTFNQTPTVTYAPVQTFTQAPTQTFTQAPTQTYAPAYAQATPAVQQQGGAEEVAPGLFRAPNYSDKYFALFGPRVQEYAPYIPRNGGSKRLKNLNTDGYLFAKNRWVADVQGIVNSVANSLRSGTAPTLAPAAPAPRRSQQSTYAFSTQAAPTFQPVIPIMQPQPPAPAPLALSPMPRIIDEPEQQTVTYVVPLPKLGQRVFIDFEATQKSEAYHVTSIEPGPEGQVDHIKVTMDGNPERVWDIGVVNGRFQIIGGNYKHVVSFS